MLPLFPKFDKTYTDYSYIGGTDEVGRGSLAGPVVAGAVLFDPHSLRDSSSLSLLEKVNDSKVMLVHHRESLTRFIKEVAVAWSVGVVSPTVIDRINIHHASLKAMRLAVNKLYLKTKEQRRGNGRDRIMDSDIFLFVDGKFVVPEVHIKQEAVIDGDAKVFSVAAASIIAKVYRDQLMMRLHDKLPHYNFAQHKGYGTREHIQSIDKYGLSKYHRRSFCKRWN